MKYYLIGVTVWVQINLKGDKLLQAKICHLVKFEFCNFTSYSSSLWLDKIFSLYSQRREEGHTLKINLQGLNYKGLNQESYRLVPFPRRRHALLAQPREQQDCACHRFALCFKSVLVCCAELVVKLAGKDYRE